MKQTILKRPLALLLALLMVFSVSATSIYHVSATTTQEVEEITYSESQTWVEFLNVLEQKMTETNKTFLVNLPKEINVTYAHSGSNNRTGGIAITNNNTVTLVPHAQGTTINYNVSGSAAAGNNFYLFKLEDGTLNLDASNARLTFLGNGGADINSSIIDVVSTNTANLNVKGDVRFANLYKNGNGSAINVQTQGNGRANINIESIGQHVPSFTGNTATENGGAIYVAENSNAKLTISNATFQNNTARNGHGGAIYTGAGVEVDISNSTFTNNTSSDRQLSGNLSIMNLDEGQIKFTGNVINDNQSGITNQEYIWGIGGMRTVNIPSDNAERYYVQDHGNWMDAVRRIREGVQQGKYKHIIELQMKNPDLPEHRISIQNISYADFNVNEMSYVTITTAPNSNIVLQRHATFSGSDYNNLFGFGGNVQVKCEPHPTSILVIEGQGDEFKDKADGAVKNGSGFYLSGNVRLVLSGIYNEQKQLNNLIIRGHRSTNSGSAIILSGNASLVANNVTFEQNVTTGNTGVIYATDNSQIRMTDSVIQGNIISQPANATRSASDDVAILTASGNATVDLVNVDASTNYISTLALPGNTYQQLLGSAQLIKASDAILGTEDSIVTINGVRQLPMLDTTVDYRVDATFETKRNTVPENGQQVFDSYTTTVTFDIFANIDALDPAHELTTLNLAFKYNADMYEPVGGHQLDAFNNVTNLKLNDPVDDDDYTPGKGLWQAKLLPPTVTVKNYMNLDNDTFINIYYANVKTDNDANQETAVTNGEYKIGSFTLQVKDMAQQDDPDDRGSAAARGLTWTANGTTKTATVKNVTEEDYDIEFLGTMNVEIDEATGNPVVVDNAYKVTPEFISQSNFLKDVLNQLPVAGQAGNNPWSYATANIPATQDGQGNNIQGRLLMIQPYDSMNRPIHYYTQEVMDPSYTADATSVAVLNLSSSAVGDANYKKAQEFWEQFKDEMKNDNPTQNGYDEWNKLKPAAKDAIDAWDYIGTRTYSKVNFSMNFLSDLKNTGRYTQYLIGNTRAYLLPQEKWDQLTSNSLKVKEKEALKRNTDVRTEGIISVEDNDSASDVRKIAKASFEVKSGQYVVIIQKDGNLSYIQEGIQFEMTREDAIQILKGNQVQYTLKNTATLMPADVTTSGDETGGIGQEDGKVNYYDEIAIGAKLGTVTSATAPENIKLDDAIYDLDGNGVVANLDVQQVALSGSEAIRLDMSALKEWFKNNTVEKLAYK